MNKKNTGVLAAALTAALLSACGGGGGSSAPTAPTVVNAEYQGLWKGTTSDSRGVTGLVLSDGTTYVIYTTTFNRNLIAGVVQGKVTGGSGSISSGDIRDFNFEGAGVLTGALSGSYTTKKSLSGTVTYAGSGGRANTFTSTYQSSYEQTPTLSAAAGAYSGTVTSSVGTQAAVLTVGSDGKLVGSANGCTSTGSITPRTDGNAYNATITFGPSPCIFAGQTFSGIAYYDSANRQLYAVTPNGNRTDGVFFIGTK